MIIGCRMPHGVVRQDPGTEVHGLSGDRALAALPEPGHDCISIIRLPVAAHHSIDEQLPAQRAPELGRNIALLLLLLLLLRARTVVSPKRHCSCSELTKLAPMHDTRVPPTCGPWLG